MIDDQKIFDYIDGRLPGEESAEIRSMIESDPDLKARVERIRSSEKMLKSVMESPSANFTDRVMTDIEQMTLAKSRGRLSKRNLFGALVVFAGIVVGIFVLSSSFIDLSLLQQLGLDKSLLTTDVVDVKPVVNLLDNDLFFKGFLFFDAFLAILLIDRLLLRPLLKRRTNFSY